MEGCFMFQWGGGGLFLRWGASFLSGGHQFFLGGGLKKIVRRGGRPPCLPLWETLVWRECKASNIIISYIFPENFIEIHQASQKILILTSLILTVFVNFVLIFSPLHATVIAYTSSFLQWGEPPTKFSKRWIWQDLNF